MMVVVVEAASGLYGISGTNEEIEAVSVEDGPRVDFCFCTQVRKQ